MLAITVEKVQAWQAIGTVLLSKRVVTQIFQACCGCKWYGSVTVQTIDILPSTVNIRCVPVTSRHKALITKLWPDYKYSCGNRILRVLQKRFFINALVYKWTCLREPSWLTVLNAQYVFISYYLYPCFLSSLYEYVSNQSL